MVNYPRKRSPKARSNTRKHSNYSTRTNCPKPRQQNTATPHTTVIQTTISIAEELHAAMLSYNNTLETLLRKNGGHLVNPLERKELKKPKRKVDHLENRLRNRLRKTPAEIIGCKGVPVFTCGYLEGLIIRLMQPSK